MTTYHSHGVTLSIGQKDKLAKALKNNSAITIRLSSSELTGPDQLMLTKTQINRLKKAMQNKTGADIKISKTHHYSKLAQNYYQWQQKQLDH